MQDRTVSAKDSMMEPEIKKGMKKREGALVSEAAGKYEVRVIVSRGGRKKRVHAQTSLEEDARERISMS